MLSRDISLIAKKIMLLSTCVFCTCALLLFLIEHYSGRGGGIIVLALVIYTAFLTFHSSFRKRDTNIYPTPIKGYLPLYNLITSSTPTKVISVQEENTSHTTRR